MCGHVEIHGELEDGMRWQLVICEDHMAAFTDRLPGIDVIERELQKKLVEVMLGGVS